jgi:hypothetical protein
MTVTLNTKTNVVHRDPGCARIFVNTTKKGRAETYREVERPPFDAHRCFYCYSRAGYRRYP